MEVDRIKALVELMTENDLTEVIIRDGESRIILRRGPQGGHMSYPPAHMHDTFHLSPHSPIAAPAPSSVPAPAATPAKPADPDAGLVAVKSPMVGTFYAASSPEAPPFVKVGSTVGPETVVCVIEAMKVFNEIKAEVSGTVERIVANNRGAVEFGQPLFLVRPG